MIVRSKDILNNKWRIDGTRISVDVVINGLEINGLDWVLKNYPRLTISDIADCLSFYTENDKEIIGGKVMKEEMLKSLNEIKNGYDAYYIENKYGEETTHKEQFEKLREYLKDDGMSMRALNWISHCYDCYYKDDKVYNIEGDANPFYYLETKIKEVK